MTRVATVTILAAMGLILTGCGDRDERGQAQAPAQSAAVTPEQLRAHAAAAHAAEGGGELLPCCDPVEQATPQKVVDADVKPQAADAKPPATEGMAPGSRASDWIDPADRVAFHLNFDFTDQDGQPVNLSSLVGKPMAVTFLFTRCPLPTMCPLIATRMAGLQEKLAQAGLAEQVHLLLVSYDPTYDTPERLHKYGADRGLQFTNAKMLRPDPEQLRHLIGELQIGVSYGPDGNIGHFIELLLIDAQGRFVRDYRGEVWNNGPVVEDLRRLIAEMQQAAAAAD